MLLYLVSQAITFNICNMDYSQKETIAINEYYS
jgi:hypothetical protein